MPASLVSLPVTFRALPNGNVTLRDSGGELLAVFQNQSVIVQGSTAAGALLHVTDTGSGTNIWSFLPATIIIDDAVVVTTAPSMAVAVNLLNATPFFSQTPGAALIGTLVADFAALNASMATLLLEVGATNETAAVTSASASGLHGQLRLLLDEVGAITDAQQQVSSNYGLSAFTGEPDGSVVALLKGAQQLLGARDSTSPNTQRGFFPLSLNELLRLLIRSTGEAEDYGTNPYGDLVGQNIMVTLKTLIRALTGQADHAHITANIPTALQFKPKTRYFIDTATGDRYVGKALVGTAVSASNWQITRFRAEGDETIKEWPETTSGSGVANQLFSYTWTAAIALSLTYAS